MSIVNKHLTYRRAIDSRSNAGSAPPEAQARPKNPLGGSKRIASAARKILVSGGANIDVFWRQKNRHRREAPPGLLFRGRKKGPAL